MQRIAMIVSFLLVSTAARAEFREIRQTVFGMD
jgi:hypothetical protein